jgi:hypothetical protein
MYKINCIKTIVALSLIAANTIIAQEKTNGFIQNESATPSTFDEASIISKLRARGISETEINSYISKKKKDFYNVKNGITEEQNVFFSCLLYTSDAADESVSV